jgi:hypothetical protein
MCQVDGRSPKQISDEIESEKSKVCLVNMHQGIFEDFAENPTVPEE